MLEKDENLIKAIEKYRKKDAPDLPKKLVEEIMTLSVKNSTSLKADIDKAIKAHLEDLET